MQKRAIEAVKKTLEAKGHEIIDSTDYFVFYEDGDTRVVASVEYAEDAKDFDGFSEPSREEFESNTIAFMVSNRIIDCCLRFDAFQLVVLGNKACCKHIANVFGKKED